MTRHDAGAAQLCYWQGGRPAVDLKRARLPTGRAGRAQGHGVSCGHVHVSITIGYWRLPATASFRDVVRQIAADEAHHSDINHTFTSMATDDPSPSIKDHLRDIDEFTKQTQKGNEMVDVRCCGCGRGAARGQELRQTTRSATQTPTCTQLSSNSNAIGVFDEVETP